MTEVVDTNDSGKLVPAAAMTRRAILVGAAASLAAACSPQTDARSYASAMLSTGDINPAYRRRRVRYDSREKPGTIMVDTASRYLYVVEDGGWATRYGVGVGRDGLALKGNATVGRKAEWPSWTPTANMMNRDPRLLQYASGVPGGPNNPLGARALYLHRGGRDTMFRLHGTNEPWSIGQAMSSGCIRLINDDVIHLYDRTPVGTRVIVA